MTRRQVTFDLEQGETAQPEPGRQAPPQAAPEPPTRNVPPPALTDRPRRERRKPAWQESGDFDMEASASTVRCYDMDESEADNSVEGVSGHVKDDLRMWQSHSENRLGGQPPPESRDTRGTAMMRDVVKVLTNVLAVLANDSEMKTGQAVVKDYA